MAEFEKKVREILSRNGCTFKRRGKGDRPTTERIERGCGKYAL